MRTVSPISLRRRSAGRSVSKFCLPIIGFALIQLGPASEPTLAATSTTSILVSAIVVSGCQVSPVPSIAARANAGRDAANAVEVNCSRPQSYQVAIESRIQTGGPADRSSGPDLADLRGYARSLPAIKVLDRPTDLAGKSGFAAGQAASPKGLAPSEPVAPVPNGTGSEVVVVNISY